MKYSDRQRVQKIYDYAARLQEYILKNSIEKEALMTHTAAVAVACHNAAI
jgi:hypothetical protein